jgi:hypothetical protein
MAFTPAASINLFITPSTERMILVTSVFCGVVENSKDCQWLLGPVYQERVVKNMTQLDRSTRNRW